MKLTIEIIDHGVIETLHPIEWDDDGNAIAFDDPYDARTLRISCGRLEAVSQTPVELLRVGIKLEEDVAGFIEAFCQELPKLIKDEVAKLDQ